MLDVQIDLAPMVSFLIQMAMATIGAAYFTGFAVKKLMQFIKSV